MFDMDLEKCSRRCSRSGRELQPGEVYFSEVRHDGDTFKRLDYASDAWTGPSEDAIGWWKSQLPDGAGNKASWAPNDVLLNLLEEKLADPLAAEFCYVLGLLLVRRKILRLEATEAAAAGGEVLILIAPKNEQEFRVPVVEPTAERIHEIQAALGQLATVASVE